MEENLNQSNMIDTKPPFFGSWRMIYLFVILAHLLTIILFYFVTKLLI